MKIAEAILIMEHAKKRSKEIYDSICELKLENKKSNENKIFELNKKYIELTATILEFEKDIIHTKKASLFNKKLTIYEADNLKEQHIEKLFKFYDVEKEVRFVNVNYKRSRRTSVVRKGNIEVLDIISVWMEIAKVSEIIRMLKVDLEKLEWKIDLI